MRDWLLRIRFNFATRPAAHQRRTPAPKRPCSACGRIVAYTLAGTAYAHRCQAGLLGAIPSSEE